MKPDIHTPCTTHTSLTSLVSLMISTALVTACGGGGNDSAMLTDTTAGASAEKSFPTDESFDDMTIAASTWVRMTEEASPFTVDGPTLVRFGVGTTWVYKTVEAGGMCNAAFFGFDPAPTVMEYCEKQVTVAAPAPAPAPVLTWVRMTEEAKPFTVDSPTLVRFGVGTAWVYKTVSTGGMCNAAFFGSDPAPTVMEYCEKQVAVTPTPSAGAASLQWSTPNSGVPSGYRVYFGTAPNTYNQNPGSGLSPGTATNYTVTGLQAGKTYYFAVKATDGSGNESPYSNEVSKIIK